jgi:DNA-binding PadR family transcriptional regulator
MNPENSPYIDQQPKPEDFIPLSPVELHVLLSLVDGPSYNYQIQKTMREISNNKFNAHERSISLSLGKFAKSGVVVELPLTRKENARGPISIDFEMTDLGRTVLQLELIRLQELVNYGVENGVVVFDQASVEPTYSIEI